MGFLIKIYDQLHLFFNKLKVLFIDLFSFLFVKIFLIFIFVFNLLFFYLSYLMYSKLSQDIVILHYNIDFGIDLIGSKQALLNFPLLSLFVFLFYIIILLFLVKRDDFKFWAYILLSFLSLFCIFISLALLSLYLINF